MSGQAPPCYGKHWDPSSRECRGGNDPAYVNPVTGTNKRDICQYYGSCSAATNSSRLREMSGVQPTPSHFQLPQAPPPPQVAPSYQVPVRQMAPTALSAPVPQPVQAPTQAIVVGHSPTQQHVVYVGQSPWTQPQFAATPMMVPMNQPMQGSAVPNFLTVPEPDNQDVPVMTRFARTIFRSTFKAMFLASANFIDYSPITPAARR